MIPKTMSSMHTSCADFEKSNLWRPNGLNVGNRKLYPNVPFEMSRLAKTTKNATHASAKVARASANAPSRRTGNAINAPTAPATTAPRRHATKKFMWPLCTTSGMSNDHFDHGGGWSAVDSWSAQPAMKPPAVANVAWARLTMPPIPVTTTNDRKMMASERPGAMIPDRTQYRSFGHGNTPSVYSTRTA